MPRVKGINFCQNRPKIRLFLQKNAKFLSVGGYIPKPPCLRWLGTRPPDPRNRPHLIFLGDHTAMSYYK